jgi:hypothetical protein
MIFLSSNLSAKWDRLFHVTLIAFFIMTLEFAERNSDISGDRPHRDSPLDSLLRLTHDPDVIFLQLFPVSVLGLFNASHPTIDATELKGGLK